MYKALKRLFRLAFAKVFHKYKVERLINKDGNEMWRIGAGYNEYRKFFRIDLGARGWRFTRVMDYYLDYSQNVYPSLAAEARGSCDALTFKLTHEQKNNPDIKVHDVTYCGTIISERVDLWEKLWVHGKSLQPRK